MFSILSGIFGSKNDREIKQLFKKVKSINLLEPEMQALSDDALKAKTGELKDKLNKGETLDNLLPEAFAVVREAGVRVLNMRHFDCQLVGGMVLHQGAIAEMRTGEGKTFVATLPAYLNALTGLGVHVVTVNDYLAKRDADWMAPLYRFLGLSIGVILSGQTSEEKKQAYHSDITYGTNNEFGFDYLRDNMVSSSEDKMQKAFQFAIVDEVDSILIDEARTPLIISGPAAHTSHLHNQIDEIIPFLKKGTKKTKQDLMLDKEVDEGHFSIDEKQRVIEISDNGHHYLEALLIERGILQKGEGLYSPKNISLLHFIDVSLKAHHLFHRDVDYIIQNNQVVIVDEHTGRTMAGRRWSDGIHQAIEAKEKVKIQQENQTLASTTFQNYFRLYTKLAGMTGTAETEALEFSQIYGLSVFIIPTNQPMIRIDHDDVIFLSEEEKYEAIIEEVKEYAKKNAPVLVGTASIESSELLSAALKKANIVHEVLNAKYHQREAEIIAQAGKPGAITIATNMAGRGTDIVLGGNWKAALQNLTSPSSQQVESLKQEWQKNHELVLQAGGLHIIGTERHESRRIDNQLRGRSGRQGDPGQTRFYLSLEDNLMRIFASDKVRNLMKSLGMQKGEAIQHRLVSRSIEGAQRKVEGRNFDMRKSLLEYDDIANEQRRIIYAMRDDLLDKTDISITINEMREEVLQDFVNRYIPAGSVDAQWDTEGLESALLSEFNVSVSVADWVKNDKKINEVHIVEKVIKACYEAYQAKEARLGDPAIFRDLERKMMLDTLDKLWREHLVNTDHLRQGIGLRGYAQKNPKHEYKKECFDLFELLLDNIRYEAIRLLSVIEVRMREEVEQMEQKHQEDEEALRKLQHLISGESDIALSEAESSLRSLERPPLAASSVPLRAGRNEPCPCGSGKKFKHCHGTIE